MYLTVIQICVTIFQTHRLEFKANQIMIIHSMIMTTQRDKSTNLGKINANIAKSILPKWDSGKFTAIIAYSIPKMGFPLMWLTFWPGFSIVRLLVCLRAE